MRLARDKDLDNINVLLKELRTIEGLVEKKRGVFYLKSRAFLHFHEDHGVMHADARIDDDDFIRISLPSRTAEKKLLAAFKRRVAGLRK